MKGFLLIEVAHYIPFLQHIQVKRYFKIYTVHFFLCDYWSNQNKILFLGGCASLDLDPILQFFGYFDSSSE